MRSSSLPPSSYLFFLSLLCSYLFLVTCLYFDRVIGRDIPSSPADTNPSRFSSSSHLPLPTAYLPDSGFTPPGYGYGLILEIPSLLLCCAGVVIDIHLVGVQFPLFSAVVHPPVNTLIVKSHPPDIIPFPSHTPTALCAFRYNGSAALQEGIHFLFHITGSLVRQPRVVPPWFHLTSLITYLPILHTIYPSSPIP